MEWQRYRGPHKTGKGQLQQVQNWLQAEGAHQGLTWLDGRPLHTLLLVGSETQGQRLPHLTVAMPEGDLLLGLCLRREQQERGQGQLQGQHLRRSLGSRDFFVSSRKEAPLRRQQQGQGRGQLQYVQS